MPESTGRLVINSVNASIPPAEAPIAAISRSSFGFKGTGVSSLEGLSRKVRFFGSDFMPFFAILPFKRATPDGGGLLELLSEQRELLLQLSDFLLKCCDFLFQTGDALTISTETVGGCFRLRLCLEHFHIAREEMGVARLFCARLPWKNLDEGRLTLHQVLQAGLHGTEVVERVHALGTGAEFAWGLRTAQEQ